VARRKAYRKTCHKKEFNSRFVDLMNFYLDGSLSALSEAKKSPASKASQQSGVVKRSGIPEVVLRGNGAVANPSVTIAPDLKLPRQLCFEALWLARNTHLEASRDVEQNARALRKIRRYASDLVRVTFRTRLVFLMRFIMTNASCNAHERQDFVIARMAVLALLLISCFAVRAAQPDGFEFDSRRVFDLCSPDQVASPGEVRFDWGHYRQWTTVNGAASGPGTFLATPWNTCLESPNYSHLEWRGHGKIAFHIRSAPDGLPKGRNQPGPWSEWLPLSSPREIPASGIAPLPDSTISRGEGKGRLEIPAALDGRQWIQVKCELGPNARLTEIAIHKKMTLPDHPRIFLTPRRIREVKDRIAQSAEVKRIYEFYVAHLKRRARQDEVRNNSNTFTAGWHMISLGMAWSLSQDGAFLEEARRQLDRLDTPWARNLSHFENPQLLGGAAILIDHVWNALTEAERRRYGAGLLFLADKQQARWRFSDVSNQIYVNSGKNVLTGLALAGAGVDSEREAFYLRQAEDLIRNHLIPGSNFWAADDGGWGEGHDYCSFTQLDWALVAQAWASASGEDIFQMANFFKFLTQWRVYERRYDGSQAKFNDSGRGSTSVPLPDFIASRWRDRIAQRQARQAIGDAMANPDDFAITHLWQPVLWFDPELPAATDWAYPESMPLGRHFAGVGHVVMRSGWGAEDVWAVFKSGNAFTPGTHYHADENSFVIDLGGSLAIDSGAYDGDASLSSHYGGYFTRSVAHNTITVMKPGERSLLGAGNDGGQLGGTWREALENNGLYDSAQWGMHLRSPLQLDGIIAFETNPHYTYSVGDATKAYSKDKVTRFVRQFLHLQPDVILVLDRVGSTDSGYEKRWLLHSVDEPDLRETTAIITHSKGRLFSQTLLPSTARITKVGGPGQEFFTEGKNHPLRDQRKQWEPGAWRVEVFPGAPHKEDVFLHYLYVTTSSTSLAPRASLTDSADQCVVRITSGGCAFEVAFNKRGDVGGRVKILGAGVSVDQPFTAAVQPQRFDTEDIWK